ncbi:hypothetical protein [Thermogutta sp.]|uniref:hypothetical protein n=1 Tax=Thermogutta sp. TaxID=1962930 RepID=UPI003C7CBBD1
MFQFKDSMKAVWVNIAPLSVCVLAVLGCQQAPQEEVVIRPEKTVVVRPTDSSSPQQPTSNENQQMMPSTESSNTPAEHPEADGGEIVLGGKYRLTVPQGWQRRTPAISMIEYEFSVPAVEGDPRDGRVTFMAAGGSVEANIQRWINQFEHPEGQPASDQVKQETLEIAGTRVHLVDITGTYMESSGPMMGNAVPRENYRMLGAVIESQDGLNYFIKFYGPRKTVTTNAEAFRKMIQSLHP